MRSARRSRARHRKGRFRRKDKVVARLRAKTRYELPAAFGFIGASGAGSEEPKADKPFEATPALADRAKTLISTAGRRSRGTASARSGKALFAPSAVRPVVPPGREWLQAGVESVAGET